ncbi:glutamine-hydrolyzing carbamoyl-phosphate synthase small subunit [Candidatus Sumerlaeota bacterium]|nr:glutamine-hydrolyzing carbamoyl-phosphate synthase small subunit [Candidatus Sumerlaeota bacterium]
MTNATLAKDPKAIDGRPNGTKARLVLEDGSYYEGTSFGYEGSIAGEVVFNTGMVGYPETLTDPSYSGQILVTTFPLEGNYGVPREKDGCEIGLPFESSRIQIQGLVVCDYSERYSHWDAKKSLADWLKENKIPALTGIDTRSLTKRLREHGTMLGHIEFPGSAVEEYDPNVVNLMPLVSPDKPIIYNKGGRKRVALIDCGAKNNIVHHLVSRGLEVLRTPWNHDFGAEKLDGIMISNGPGDPKQCAATIKQIQKLLERRIPTFGICLGNQLLALSIGADTYKLKYGHRGQNQPVIDVTTNRCYVTSQNHGFAVNDKSLPEGWKVWFKNLNDDTNEGIRHETQPFRSVQFHPEAAPGPVDTEYLFDDLVSMMDKS